MGKALNRVVTITTSDKEHFDLGIKRIYDIATPDSVTVLGYSTLLAGGLMVHSITMKYRFFSTDPRD